MADVDKILKTETRAKVEKPKLYKVIVLNDDYTPRDFVVGVLRSVFRMTDSEALAVMMAAHQKGVAVVAVFTREVAEHKAQQGNDKAAEAGHPLTFTTEREA